MRLVFFVTLDKNSQSFRNRKYSTNTKFLSKGSDKQNNQYEGEIEANRVKLNICNYMYVTLYETVEAIFDLLIKNSVSYLIVEALNSIFIGDLDQNN